MQNGLAYLNRQPSPWLVVVGMIAYPALKLFGATGTTTLAAGLVYALASWLLAVYLFYSVTALAGIGHSYWLWFGALGGALVGYVVGGLGNLWLLVIFWSELFLTSMVAGRLIRMGRRPLQVYVIGLAMILVANLAWQLPRWGELMQAAQKVGNEAATQFEAGMIASGYSQALVEEYSHTFKKVVDMTVRLTPASTIAGSFVPFSLGFFWFLRRRSGVAGEGILSPYLLWKMPFAATGLVVLAAAGRLTGGETVKLIADNMLTVLAIYYCVTGLAFVEFYMRRFGFSRLMRVIFYFMLFVTQVAGFLVMALVGLADSYFDWRKISAGHFTLEE